MRCSQSCALARVNPRCWPSNCRSIPTTPKSMLMTAERTSARKEAAAKAERALSRHVHLERFEENRINVSGIAINFASARSPPKSDTTLILVHGLGLSYRYMLPTAQALMDDFRVLLPDLPGFGGSGKPKKILGIDALADSLASWIMEMRLQPRVALLGNSLACQIIAAALDRHPTIADAAVWQGPTTPPNERNVFWQLLRWRQNLRYDPPDMKAISRDDYFKCGRRRVWKTFFHALHDRMEDRLPRLHHRILVVRGERDPICREEWAIDVANRLPYGTLVQIPGVAHTLVFTAPAQLAEVTRAFLRRS